MNRVHFVAKRPLPPEVFPKRTTRAAAGIDLFALETRELKPQTRALIGTGWEVMLPMNTYGRIADVSSLTLLTGVHVIGGVIDEDYEGEVCVLLSNPTANTIVIRPCTKIAQLIITPYHNSQPAIITPALRSHIELLSARKTSGFGFTNAQEALSANQDLSTHSVSTGHETWSRCKDRGSQTSEQAIPRGEPAIDEVKITISDPAAAKPST
jgi:dUTP pyrophosphatase